MAKVTIEIYSWLADLLSVKGQKKTSGVVLQREISEGDTVIDVLHELTAKEKKLEQALFDPASGRLTDQISIALNNRFIHLLDGEDTLLNDGDHIILFQAWCGG